MSYWFCSKFYMLSTTAKILKIGQDWTKLQRVKRWELFLRHSVYYADCMMMFYHRLLMLMLNVLMLMLTTRIRPVVGR